MVYLYGDNSGKKGVPGRNKTHYQLYKKVLMANGWRIVDFFGDNVENDKSSESNIHLAQQYATHLSDAFDYIL